MSEFISEYGDVILEAVCASIIIGFFLMLTIKTGTTNLIFQMISMFLNSIA